jgi:hypothetical protein
MILTSIVRRWSLIPTLFLNVNLLSDLFLISRMVEDMVLCDVVDWVRKSYVASIWFSLRCLCRSEEAFDDSSPQSSRHPADAKPVQSADWG